MASCYGWGSTVSRLKPLWGYSLLLLSSPGNVLVLIWSTPRKDERLSPPWNHLVALSAGPLDWGSSALTTRPLLHSLEKKTLLLGSECISPHNIPEKLRKQILQSFCNFAFLGPKSVFSPHVKQNMNFLKNLKSYF